MLKSMKIFDTIDSTNLHATRLISEGMSVHGDTIVAKHQTHGKGQREKKWEDAIGQSVLMSIILHEHLDKLSILNLNKIVALSVLHVLQDICASTSIRIKWPNDIFIENKKVCGILIENGFKGSIWSHSIIGIGINVLQREFSEELDTATSLFLETKKEFNILSIAEIISENILQEIQNFSSEKNQQIHSEFFEHLYKINDWVDVELLSEKKKMTLYFQGVDEWGRAKFSNAENEQLVFNHGEIRWIF